MAQRWRLVGNGYTHTDFLNGESFDGSFRNGKQIEKIQKFLKYFITRSSQPVIGMGSLSIYPSNYIVTMSLSHLLAAK